MKKVVFNFDDESWITLNQIQAIGRYSSPADTIAHAIQILKFMQLQYLEGFTEISMRNPLTDVERSGKIHLGQVSVKNGLIGSAGVKASGNTNRTN